MAETNIKRIVNGVNLLQRSGKNLHEVWSDMLDLFAITISNSCTKGIKQFDYVWEERENRYLKTIAKYTKKEQNLFPQMFALLVEEYERCQEQDLLGELFMKLEISNKNNGQFFTPYSISKLMAEITIDKKSLSGAVKEKGFASFCDPACGAGATLIAAIDVCKQMFKRLNYQNHIFFVGQDIDGLAVKMCYIQISLLGVAGFVKAGNTLTEPDFVIKDKDGLLKYWFTPMYFNDVWTMRRVFHNLDIFTRRAS